MRYFRKLLGRLVTFHAYSQPDAVGYAGSVSLPIVGCVAFVRRDGSLLFDW